MTIAVSLKGITKRFDEVVAVDDVSIDIADGEFFSLLGPSGCGKTTLLRMIAGLEFPTAGTIEIHGEVQGLRPPDKRPVNTVFQSYALFPHMSVTENIGFGLRMKNVSESEIKARVDEVIGLVQLTGMERRRPDQMSGGQQQRVALARALVNKPEVLLLDEPLGALDLKLRQAMQFELKELQQRVGITFVYVTHDQEEALTMSDRIAVMNSGELLQVAAPEEMYERPANRFVASFIGETNFLRGEVAAPGRVRIEGGIEVGAHTESAPGTAVMLALRPEKMFLAPADADRSTFGPDDTLVDGEVLRKLYMGDHLFYEIRLAGGAVVKVWEQNAPRVLKHDPGAKVIVDWRSEAVTALEE